MGVTIISSKIFSVLTNILLKEIFLFDLNVMVALIFADNTNPFVANGNLLDFSERNFQNAGPLLSDSGEGGTLFPRR